MAQNNSSNYKTTQHNVIIGAASNLIANVAPNSVSGTPFCSAGSSSNPTFNTTPTVSQMTVSNNPVNGSDTATKSYVDSAISAVNPSTSVYAATTTNIPGTYTPVGSGVGDTFLTTATGAFSLDGTSPAVASRILFKNQATAAYNGVYTLTTNGTGGTGTLFTRAVDYDTPSNINSTGVIAVVNGTVNALTGWLIDSTVTNVGSDAINYIQYNGAPISVTQHYALVGGASNSLTSVSPSTASYVMTSNGTGSDPSFQAPIGTSYAANSTLDFVDDFLYGYSGAFTAGDQIAGVWDVLNATSGGEVQLQNTSVAGHPGTALLTAGSATSGSIIWSMYAQGVTSGGEFIVGAGQITLTFYFNLLQLSTGTNTFTLYLGLGDSTVGGTTNSISVQYNSGVNSGKWTYQCTAASSQTTSNSSATVATGWQVVQMVINAAGTSVSFSAGTTLANLASLGSAITTHIPSAAIAPFISILKSAGSTQPQVNLDLVTINQVLTTAR